MRLAGKGWKYGGGAIAVVALIVIGLGYYRSYDKTRQLKRHQRAAVADMTEAAEALVSLLRRDAPAGWDIERVIDYHVRGDSSHAFTFKWDELGERLRESSARVGELGLGRSPMAYTARSMRIFDAFDLSPEQIAQRAEEFRALDVFLDVRRERVGLAPLRLALAGEPLPELPIPIPIGRLDYSDAHLGVWPGEHGIVVLEKGKDGVLRWLSIIDWSGRVGPAVALGAPADELYKWVVTGDGTLCGLGGRWVEKRGRRQWKRPFACYALGAATASFAVALPEADDSEHSYDIWAADTHVVVRVGAGLAAVSADGELSAVASLPASIHAEASLRRSVSYEPFTTPDGKRLLFSNNRGVRSGCTVRSNEPGARRTRVAELRPGAMLERVVSDDHGRMVLIIAHSAGSSFKLVRQSIVFSADGGVTWRGALAGDCANNPWCEQPETICNDDFDNDRDQLVDCADPDCAKLCPRCGDSDCERSFCGREEEQNCPASWLGDGSCDCGCQFCDVDCKACQ